VTFDFCSKYYTMALTFQDVCQEKKILKSALYIVTFDFCSKYYTMALTFQDLCQENSY
jgi:hypothetical protein